MPTSAQKVFSRLNDRIKEQSGSVWKAKAFWMRALLCWVIGSAFVINDEHSNYDLRFRMRGQQPHAADIVLIEIPEREWMDLHNNRNMIRTLKEITNFSDAFFWDLSTWDRFLTNLLANQPAAVGVSLYFGENIPLPYLNERQRATFADPRIVWAADVDDSGRALVPVFASPYSANIGIKNLHADSDGILRRLPSAMVDIPHFATRLSEIAHRPPAPIEPAALINFTGPSGSFHTLDFRAVLDGQIDPRELRGKIVIVGTGITSPGSGLADQMQTPVGRMSRAEILANVTDNVVHHKWIERFYDIVYLLLLAFLIVLSIWIISSYPQSVALVFFVFIATLLAAFSAWIFDTYQVWLPALSPAVQLSLTYILFLSYRLSFNEQKNWQLEQEKRYLEEIEQLKNNFVSMMSHDLKTPIAKIQAIVDRLLTVSPENENAGDLRNLRKSSEDLNRYIQSILQVTKVEAKDFKIRKEVTDINENIERVVAKLQPLASERGLSLEQQLEPMFSIEVDTTLIEEVILNLVENAIKYTPAGGAVRIISQEKDDNVEVIIEDTGPGIAPDEQDQVWGKFTRGKTGTDNTRGTGLGLYLVKYFIELHGGRVFLESAVGHGTKIGFSIPITEPETEKEV